MPDEPNPAALRLLIRELKSPLAGPFSFELAAGASAVISGPSGSGKSLFLRMIADLDPNDGEASIDGASRAAMSAPEWRRRAPYVAADAGWWLDDVNAHFAPDQQANGRALAQRLGLTDGQFDGPVRRLSTGERQRLAIIRALVLESRVLLLDEPTGALDPEATGAVEDLLKARLAGGAAILMVSHDGRQAERLNARRYEMRARKLSGPT